MINVISNHKIELLIIILGVLSGIGCFFIPVKYLILAFGAVIGTILVFWKLEIGIFSVVFLLPFLPTMALVGLIILTVCSFITRMIVKGTKIKYSPSYLWIGIFGGLTLLYSIFSATPSDSIKVALVVLSYISLFVVTVNTITKKNLLYALILTLVFSASLESLYGIYQYKIGVPTVDENWTDVNLFPDMYTRVFGTLDNPNILAQYLEFIIPLCLGLFWSSKSIIKKIAFLGLASIMILCLVLTGSRGGWIAFALSIAVFGILRDRRILVLAAIAGLISIPFLPSTVLDRIATIGSLGESSNLYRTFIWSSTLNMIKDFWYSGVGVGVKAFEAIYNAHYIKQGVHAFHSHNLYLQTMVEMGILGFLSFLAVVFSTFRQGIQTIINLKDELSKTIVAALLGGMSGFLLHGISENSFYNFKIVFMFWFIASLVISSREILAETNDGYFKH